MKKFEVMAVASYGFISDKKERVYLSQAPGGSQILFAK